MYSRSLRVRKSHSCPVRSATAREYASFAALHEKFGAQGLEIVIFPCAQFGGQEHPTGQRVVDFAKSKNFEGTVMSIADVKGPSTRPSWKVFYDETGAAPPGWNFSGKFLVGKDGKVTVPKNLDADIAALLA